MQRHFVQELNDLKSNIIRMGSFAEEAIAESIKAVLERRTDIAKQVLANDQRINFLEVQNDNSVLDLLALQQPVATDLRFILAAMKINNELERIGDHAVNIAESAIAYAKHPPLPVELQIPRMAEITQAMLRDSIDGFIHNTPGLCHIVLRNDDLIDNLNRQTVGDLVQLIKEDPAIIDQALDLIRVSRNLERVADLATNIAEEVIFAAEAKFVKHSIPEGSDPVSPR